ncbi:MAG: hypothetical protein RL653_3008 [Pseudomonadota bacterium]
MLGPPLAGVEMPKLDELVANFKKVGESAFLTLHNVPVLVGRGIAGVMTVQKQSGATMAAEIGPYIESLTWMDRVFELRGGKAVSVGRTADSDVVINDFSVSRQQCTFQQQGDGWLLTDAGSTNGTVVAGKKYKAPQSVLLKGGEELVLGRLAFEFHTPLSLVAKIRAGKAEVPL